MTVRSTSLDGVPGYREFLIRTEGAADPVRRQLARREQLFAELSSHPRPLYAADPEAFVRNLRAPRPEPGLDRRMLWLLATAKLNQSERFGIGLGEVYARTRTSSIASPSVSTCCCRSTITPASWRT